MEFKGMKGLRDELLHLNLFTVLCVCVPRMLVYCWALSQCSWLPVVVCHFSWGNAFFWGAWVLCTNLGYLRNVYAGLLHVEGGLHGSASKNCLCERVYASVLNGTCSRQPLAAQPTPTQFCLHNLTHAILPTQSCLRLKINKCLREEHTPSVLHCLKRTHEQPSITMLNSRWECMLGTSQTCCYMDNPMLHYPHCDGFTCFHVPIVFLGYSVWFECLGHIWVVGS